MERRFEKEFCHEARRCFSRRSRRSLRHRRRGPTAASPKAPTSATGDRCLREVEGRRCLQLRDARSPDLRNLRGAARCEHARVPSGSTAPATARSGHRVREGKAGRCVLVRDWRPHALGHVRDRPRRRQAARVPAAASASLTLVFAHRSRDPAAGRPRRSYITAIGDMTPATRLIGVQEIRCSDVVFHLHHEHVVCRCEPVGKRRFARRFWLAGRESSCGSANVSPARIVGSSTRCRRRSPIGSACGDAIAHASTRHAACRMSLSRDMKICSQIFRFVSWTRDQRGVIVGISHAQKHSYAHSGHSVRDVAVRCLH